MRERGRLDPPGTPSLRMMFETWTDAVFGLMKSTSAIWPLSARRRRAGGSRARARSGRSARRPAARAGAAVAGASRSTRHARASARASRRPAARRPSASAIADRLAQPVGGLGAAAGVELGLAEPHERVGERLGSPAARHASTAAAHALGVGRPVEPRPLGVAARCSARAAAVRVGQLARSSRRCGAAAGGSSGSPRSRSQRRGVGLDAHPQPPSGHDQPRQLGGALVGEHRVDRSHAPRRGRPRVAGRPRASRVDAAHSWNSSSRPAVDRAHRARAGARPRRAGPRATRERAHELVESTRARSAD